ncbi:MAG TPA: ABC transporter substrate-binding protein [Lacunisphaera sp.]|jgi:ABC-type Fe3+ transport system substrate-binding protein|nr:ABC transporter substrate-binding protein [Lacunisphaera sp.]
MKRAIILLALVVIVALPFALRRSTGGAPAADDTLVIVTPNNEAIRHEIGLAFTRWYRAHTGRSIAIDWRVLGGTSEISRFLEGEYTAAFRRRWTTNLHGAWNAEVQAAAQDGNLGADAPQRAREARAAFLASNVGCGIDLFFGGDAYTFADHARAGRLVRSAIMETHPEWFADGVIPRVHAGETYWDRDGRWFGYVLGSYGILYNRDALRRLGLASPPAQWADLADWRYVGELALCDPTKSGSMTEAFENVIQQQMHASWRRLQAAQPDVPAANLETAAVAAGWMDGLRLLQQLGANARYFSDTSQKPPIDVAAGNCAAGMCIDFYGRGQVEATTRRGGSDRLGFAAPPGGTAYSVDPVGILRGARHRPAAEAFIEFLLSLEGQRLWSQKPGTPSGPEQYALRRLPVRRDFYAHEEWRGFRSDPEVDPYAASAALVYQPAWTGGLFREIAFIARVMCQDTQEELRRAWQAIHAPGVEAARAAAATRILQDLSFVSYDQARTTIKAALEVKDKAAELRLARELGDRFRRQYTTAAAIARGEAVAPRD